jgi:hypothetical protein
MSGCYEKGELDILSFYLKTKNSNHLREAK